MFSVQIDNEIYPCKIESTSTQFGQDVIRVISETAPLAEHGFYLVDNQGNIIDDKSDYMYLYREDTRCKEYTKEPVTIIPTECSYTEIPEGIYASLSRQISYCNNRITEITPYVATKTAYIDDTECIFTNVYAQGNITAFVEVNGIQIPCEVARYENNVIVSFEALEEVGIVTISII